MSAFCDLHIHSCVSPCGDAEMTPWDLVGMAKVNGLDVIALTDHNTCLNTPQAVAAGKTYGIDVIPGIEITTREEVHLLGYFYTVADALAAGNEVYEHLPDVPNHPLLFGEQTIIGDEDAPCGTVAKLLINATDLDLDAACELIHRYGGLAIPAHINRGANGMIGALGLMPFLPQYPVVEVYSGVDCPAYATRGRFLLHSSDAHYLKDIQERVFELDAEPTAKAVLDLLKAYGA